MHESFVLVKHCPLGQRRRLRVHIGPSHRSTLFFFDSSIPEHRKAPKSLFCLLFRCNFCWSATGVLLLGCSPPHLSFPTHPCSIEHKIQANNQKSRNGKGPFLGDFCRGSLCTLKSQYTISSYIGSRLHQRNILRSSLSNERRA